VTPALARCLRSAFRTDDLTGMEQIEKPWDDRVVFRLGGRQVEIAADVLRRLEPPPPPWNPLMDLLVALWDSEKRAARTEDRVPSPEALWERMQEQERQ
jgi:hypothetical protein